MIQTRLTPDPSLPWPINWAGMTLLCSRERCSLVPYLDSAGIPTQGWGETLGVTMADAAWTEEECDARLLARLTAFTKSVRLMCSITTTPNELAALVVCAYNIGLAAMRASTIIHQHNLGNFMGAAFAFGLWDKVHDPVTHQLVDSNGLKLRRQAEAALYLKA